MRCDLAILDLFGLKLKSHLLLSKGTEADQNFLRSSLDNGVEVAYNFIILHIEDIVRTEADL